MLHKDLTQKIINAASGVHFELGGGLPKNLYLKAMEIELHGEFVVTIERKVPIAYKGFLVGEMVADLSINDVVLVMCASAAEINAAEEYNRLRAMLRSLRLDVGLLLNFNKGKLDVRRVEVGAKPRPRQQEDASGSNNPHHNSNH